MDDCERFHYLLGMIHHSKHEFLDWLEFLDYYESEFYEVIINWSEEKVIQFVKQWDCNLDTIDESVYEFDDEYIGNGGEKENNPASREQSYSEKL